MYSIKIKCTIENNDSDNEDNLNFNASPKKSTKQKYLKYKREERDLYYGEEPVNKSLNHSCIYYFN